LVGEQIEKIKEAEESARNNVSESQAEYDRMLRDARGKTEGIIAEAKKQIAEEKNLIIKKAEEEAAKIVAQLEKENETAREDIRATAEGNKSKAASFIIGRLIG